MIKYLILILVFVLHYNVKAQETKNIHLPIEILFNQEQIVLDSTYLLNEEEVHIHTLKFYLSNFTFLNNQATVFTLQNGFYLVDLEDSTSLSISFDIPDSLEYNLISFSLGIDSLINVSGVMGGDLDPMKGMYWSWNTGYINFKLEGSYPLCESKGNSYQFHLGGYMSPFLNTQEMVFPIDDSSNFILQLELSDFFNHINLTKDHTIMSPSSEAVILSQLVAESFSFVKND